MPCAKPNARSTPAMYQSVSKLTALGSRGVVLSLSFLFPICHFVRYNTESYGIEPVQPQAMVETMFRAVHPLICLASEV